MNFPEFLIEFITIGDIQLMQNCYCRIVEAQLILEIISEILHFHLQNAVFEL